MSERAEAYAKQFEAANADLIKTVEGLSDAQWQKKTAPEGWTVGCVAHHIGSSHGPVSGLAMALASGQTVPLTMDMINQGNAQHAQEHANVSKADALKALREGGAQAAAAVRTLSDEQLESAG